MRARLPDRADVVRRDGVRVAFEVFGQGEPALLLIPASPITHARSWKGIIPSLARRFTVVTTDGRGTGRSDRPRTPECYAPAEVTADLLAVLDAAGIDLAFLVAHCHAVPWALCLAATTPGVQNCRIDTAVASRRPSAPVGRTGGGQPGRRTVRGVPARGAGTMATATGSRVLLRPAAARAAFGLNSTRTRWAGRWTPTPRR
jgi:pimeloyl-ACP methyl ester carboxylesterase